MDTPKELTDRTCFSLMRIEKVQDLQGFEKHHSVPTTVSMQTRAWLETITLAALDHQANLTFDSLRKQFRFKRRELEAHGPVDRHVVISTPALNAEISVDFHESDPTHVVWRYEINQIRNIDVLLDERFLLCFPDGNWTLEVESLQDLDIAGLIDHVEDLDDDELTVNYDKDLRTCVIHHEQVVGEVSVRRNSFCVTREKRGRPGLLLQDLFQMQQLLDHYLGSVAISGS